MVMGSDVVLFVERVDLLVFPLVVILPFSAISLFVVESPFSWAVTPPVALAASCPCVWGVSCPFASEETFVVV